MFFHFDCGLKKFTEYIKYIQDMPGFKSLNKKDKEFVVDKFTKESGHFDYLKIAEDAVICDCCETLIGQNFYQDKSSNDHYCLDCKKDSIDKSFNLIKFIGKKTKKIY